MATFIQRGYNASTDRFGIEQGDILYHADTLAEARTLGDPFLDGVPLVARRIAADATNQHYDVTLSYEGKSSQRPPANAEVTESVEGEVTFVHEPIETHPNIQSLISKFGGTMGKDGKITFSLAAPASNSSGTGLGGKKTSARNPLYGATTYAVAGMEVIHTFVDDRLPDSIFREINTIITELPSSVPSRGRPATPPNRNWMILAPKWIQRGNVVQIFKRYRLSPPGGFTKEIYLLT